MERLKAYIENLWVFRCIACAHVPNPFQKKLDDYDQKCICDAQMQVTKSCKLYNSISKKFISISKKFILSRNVTFDKQAVSN